MRTRKFAKDLEELELITDYLSRLVCSASRTKTKKDAMEMKRKVLKLNLAVNDLLWTKKALEKSRQEMAASLVRLTNDLNALIKKYLNDSQVQKMRTAIRQERHKKSWWEPVREIKELVEQVKSEDLENMNFDFTGQTKIEF